MIQIKHGTVSVEPILLADAKTYLKVDYSDEDALITSLIKSVREDIEKFTGLSITAKTIEYFNDEIPEVVYLPYPSHTSITEVKINDVVTTSYKKTGITQFILYFENTSLSNDNGQGLYVKFVTDGYCPEGIKSAMYRELDERYRNRGNTFEGSISQLSSNTYSMLYKYCQI